MSKYFDKKNILTEFPGVMASVVVGAVWPADLFERLYFEHWIILKEIGWSKLKSIAKRWHDGEIFLAGNMMKSHCVPQHNIFLLYFPVPANRMQAKQPLFCHSDDTLIGCRVIYQLNLKILANWDCVLHT